jgi:hypothetical protein
MGGHDLGEDVRAWDALARSTHSRAQPASHTPVSLCLKRKARQTLITIVQSTPTEGLPYGKVGKELSAQMAFAASQTRQSLSWLSNRRWPGLETPM